MKRLLQTALCCWLCCISLCAQPSSKEQKDAKFDARAFLANHGADGAGSDLACSYWTDHTMMLTNSANNVFVLMAREDVVQRMNERVLAFSVGAPCPNVAGNNTMVTVINTYDSIVARMDSDIVYETGTVKPMMTNIRWHHITLRDVFEGQTEGVISGCGPVAVGQLMRHYEWPADYDWNKTKSVYRKNDPEADAIIPLMKRLGLAMKVKYGANYTNTQMDSVKPAMVADFGYSPSMFLALSGLTQNELARLVCKDLQAGRPVILCGCDHIWVCDGMHDGFLHFNMGWGGEFDGWYRIPHSAHEVGHGTLLRSALLNISPAKAPVAKTITLAAAGTLSKKLTADERATITKLKVNGPINGADIRLMRRMAGLQKMEEYDSWHGALTDLDLSDATIVTDTAAFEVYDVSRTRYNVTVNGIKYNFGTMTHAQWLRFVQDGGNKSPVLQYREIKPGAKYELRASTRANYVLPWMFEYCENLRAIKLPRNTRTVHGAVFGKNPMLTRILIPKEAVVHNDVCGNDAKLQKAIVKY